MDGAEEEEGVGGGQRFWEGTACSIIPAQTPLGFRVRDSMKQWRDKSLPLTFERIATYSNNPLRGGGFGGEVEGHCMAILGFLLSLQSSRQFQHTAGKDKTGRVEA